MDEIDKLSSSRYLASLRGHVQRVYQIAFSADSRLICSGSADSTLKVHEVRTRKMIFDLPGHADEVSSNICSVKYNATHKRKTAHGELWLTT